MPGLPVISYRSVSIHARVERATAFQPSGRFQALRFNPRTRRACDKPRWSENRCRRRRFNPRTRRACDPHSCCGKVFFWCFNPRTRRACDHLALQAPKIGAVSIHARVERATLPVLPPIRKADGFNPRTRRACDGKPANIRNRRKRFNPRTRRACDMVFHCILCSVVAFQSTHA